MNTYELITPGDPITFKADNDKVAFMCALLLGNGKAGCTNDDTGESVPSLMLFCTAPDAEIRAYLDCDPKQFIEDNRQHISYCFASFSYGRPSERRDYDDAIEAITDPEKLKEFKAKHEDRNRSSMSKWVANAWKMGERFSIPQP